MKKIPSTVVVIGAGRSGTKILRDVLCRLSGWGTWSCDEINYIWRYGNARMSTDELSRKHAQPKVVQYIRNEFRKIAHKKNLDVVVEKTCANTLRVPFVKKVLPDAKFVHIVRDGRDVAVSARQRWTGSTSIKYLLRKARYIPPMDLPYYALRFFTDRLHRFYSEDGRVAAWGPRFSGMRDLLQNYSLLEVCGLQWKHCVEKAASDLNGLNSNQKLKVHYEDFVRSPVESMKVMSSFLGFGENPDEFAEMTADVSSDSVGNWRERLSEEKVRSVHKLLKPALQEFGYLD